MKRSLIACILIFETDIYVIHFTSTLFSLINVGSEKNVKT